MALALTPCTESENIQFFDQLQRAGSRSLPDYYRFQASIFRVADELRPFVVQVVQRLASQSAGGTVGRLSSSHVRRFLPGWVLRVVGGGPFAPTVTFVACAPASQCDTASGSRPVPGGPCPARILALTLDRLTELATCVRHATHVDQAARSNHTVITTVPISLQVAGKAFQQCHRDRLGARGS